MDVFLTGATGYIGGAIADALLRAGHGVLGLARSDKVAEVMRARSISPLRRIHPMSTITTRTAPKAHYRQPAHPWSGWLLLLPVF